jgi:uncharacterized membrane protein
MKDWLVLIAHHSTTVIDAMALAVIVAGTFQAFVSGLYVLVTSSGAHESRDVWLRYARWLVAGLTFQLASDIIETSIAPTWDDIGRLGVVAVIRTLLNYFLERDLAEVRERQIESERRGATEARRTT